MDNAHPSNSGRAQRCIEASRAERLPRPAYSSGPAPSDLFLFGYIKGKLFYHNCESREDLLNAITEFFTGVGEQMLFSIFESWVNRLNLVIKHEGKDYSK
jgi:hypothetical protein